MRVRLHIMMSITPKHSVSQVVGYMKGKSAIHLARVYMGKKRNYVGQSFWARGYYVSTVGRDEQVVREYIRNQEAEERRIDQLECCANLATLGGSHKRAAKCLCSRFERLKS